MRALYGVILVLTVLPFGAYGATNNPIRYEVDGNNRIFVRDDGTRFVEDLHVYMRCADALKEIPEKCREYRKHGVVDGVFVPNLRNGSEHSEYRLQYDKATHAFPAQYAVDGRRKIQLSLDKRWLAEQSVTAQTCR
jgi:hypothetical protein